MKIRSLSEAQRVGETPVFVGEFARMPGLVREEPYRAGLLPEMVWQAFLLQPTPFAKEFWTIESGDRVIARLGASVSAARPGTGAVGFFEVDMRSSVADKAGFALLERAFQWLKSNGVSTAYGPMNFNTWFPYRFRIGQGEKTQGLEEALGRHASVLDHVHPDDEKRFSWEPVNPPGYVEIFAASGFKPVEIYHSQGHEGLEAFAQATKGAYDKAASAGYVFRAFDSQRVMETDVPALYEISMQGFSNNFLFEPIPFEAFRALYVPIAGKLDLSLSHLASDASGKPLAFFFCYEDQGYVVLKSVAVSPEARGKGLSNAVAHLAAAKGVERGLTKMITALVKSGAQSESYAKKVQLLWEHRYALFERKL